MLHYRYLSRLRGEEIRRPRRRRRRADRGRLRACRRDAARRRRRGPWCRNRLPPAPRRRGRPTAGGRSGLPSKRDSSRRLVCVEPQVRPSSQRGASIARSSGWPNSTWRVNTRSLRLRLAVAAHGAIGHDAAVLERGERRVERVERPPARRQRVQRLGVEREARAAVLHQHAGARQHAAGAELPVDRLDVGDDEAAASAAPIQIGVALAVRRRPGRGLAAVDLAPPRRRGRPASR